MIKRIEMILGGSWVTFAIGDTLRVKGEETKIKTKSIEIKKGKIILKFSDKSSAEYVGVTQYSIWR